MLFLVAALGLALSAVTLWCAVSVARMRGLPPWRRYLPLAFFLVALGTSLLRAFGVHEPAEAVAFPLNLAALLLALREIRRRGRR
ncbi:hypothetical protein ACIPSE_21890 [Streptomyces sp. NPDC090106]|uniref:hypothetical protein n=1 Tax=Streptomyces sp. NPDC090106 TaxID=3365946 RepID=UPI00382941A0